MNELLRPRYSWGTGTKYNYPIDVTVLLGDLH